MTIEKEKIVCVSGYFNPIHIGHVRMFQDAKKLGDKLIVIVNNDKQAMMKKGKIIVPEKHRLEMVKAIKWVDDALLAIDEDKTVCETLRMIKPDIFANGGDRNQGNVPEDEVCQELGIEMVYNVGEGGKVDSSTNIIKRASSQD
jgi:cytidyltransferase-like protein